MMTPFLNKSRAEWLPAFLLETGSISVRSDPYTLTSGRHSPVLCGLSPVNVFPGKRRSVINLAAEQINRYMGSFHFDVIAGGETAGIPYASWIADRLHKPMIYIRKKPKGFGHMSRIEGVYLRDNMFSWLKISRQTVSLNSISSTQSTKLGTMFSPFVIFFYDIFSKTRSPIS